MARAGASRVGIYSQFTWGVPMIFGRKLWRRLGVVLNLRDPPTVPPYGWSYFDHIVALYVNVNIPDQRADRVIEKSRERPDDLTWGDIFLLESVVFSLLPTDMVERNAWIMRERLRSIASPTIYQKYIDSGVPSGTDTPAKAELLRADLSRVLDILHWYYSLIPQRERIRKSLTVACIWCVVLYTAFLGLAAYKFQHDHSLMTLLGVIYCGIIGGFVSSQRRMQNIPSDGDPLVSVLGLDISGYYLWLSPMLGGIFAVLLMLMFLGQILQGIAFPSFMPPDIAHASSLYPLQLSSSAEYGKLFVWAFLAGFAERLVPDSLDRLSEKVLSVKDPGPASPLPPSSRNGAAPNGTDKADGDQGGQGVQDGTNNGNGDVPKPQQQAEEPKIAAETLEDVMHTGEAPVGPFR